MKKTRILLINFTEKDTAKIESLDIQVERGYLSTPHMLINPDSTREYSGYFYAPHPIYEYRVAFINLKNIDSLSDEFKNKKLLTTKGLQDDFIKFWTKKGVLVFFLCDLSYAHLNDFGVPIKIENSSNQDITAHAVLDPKTPFRKKLNDIKNNLVMPTKKYIKTPSEYIGEFYIKPIYKNNNDKVLAYYCNAEGFHSEYDQPGFLILPEFKNNILIVKMLLEEFAQLFPKLIPELHKQNWAEDESYFPNEISSYDIAIDNLARDTETKIKEIKSEKEKAKTKYKHLKGILLHKGDELVEDVIWVLRNIFKMKVTDCDKINKGLPAEDIIIKCDNQAPMLAEIKGDSSQNPSQNFITQVWKHLAKNQGTISNGALILNHDIKTEPSKRNTQYAGAEEKQIEDITLIDTRVLFDLALAIIDHDFPIEKAQNMLFSKGRIVFNLEGIESPKK